jgi:hypothetical protein
MYWTRVVDLKNGLGTGERRKMPRKLPDIPRVRCEGCDGDRFIPLTFPTRKAARTVVAQARPTAKCMTCGQLHFPRSALELNDN